MYVHVCQSFVPLLKQKHPSFCRSNEFTCTLYIVYFSFNTVPPLTLHMHNSSYHHKVPEELPVIEKKQVYGLATPEDFTLPPHHTLWTPESYAAFEVSAQASEKYDTKVGKS